MDTALPPRELPTYRVDSADLFCLTTSRKNAFGLSAHSPKQSRAGKTMTQVEIPELLAEYAVLRVRRLAAMGELMRRIQATVQVAAPAPAPE